MKKKTRTRIHFVVGGIVKKLESIASWDEMYACVVRSRMTNSFCSNDGEYTLLDFETVEWVVP